MADSVLNVQARLWPGCSFPRRSKRLVKECSRNWHRVVQSHAHPVRSGGMPSRRTCATFRNAIEGRRQRHQADEDEIALRIARRSLATIGISAGPATAVRSFQGGMDQLATESTQTWSAAYLTLDERKPLVGADIRNSTRQFGQDGCLGRQCACQSQDFVAFTEQVAVCRHFGTRNSLEQQYWAKAPRLEIVS